MRQSSTVIPPALGKAFAPTVQSPLRTIVSTGPHEVQVDAGAGGKVNGEHSDGGPGLVDPASGTSSTYDIQHDVASIGEISHDDSSCEDSSDVQGAALDVVAETAPTTPVRSGGQKRTIKSLPERGRLVRRVFP